jgi:hypothetical protein
VVARFGRNGVGIVESFLKQAVAANMMDRIIMRK